jgi:hypothetical protein
MRRRNHRTVLRRRIDGAIPGGPVCEADDLRQAGGIELREVTELSDDAAQVPAAGAQDPAPLGDAFLRKRDGEIEQRDAPVAKVQQIEYPAEPRAQPQREIARQCRKQGEGDAENRVLETIGQRDSVGCRTDGSLVSVNGVGLHEFQALPACRAW